MGLRSMLGRFDRLVGRFNKWLAPAAIASGAETPGSGYGQAIDPANVSAIVTELGRPSTTLPSDAAEDKRG